VLGYSCAPTIVGKIFARVTFVRYSGTRATQRRSETHHHALLEDVPIAPCLHELMMSTRLFRPFISPHNVPGEAPCFAPGAAGASRSANHVPLHRCSRCRQWTAWGCSPLRRPRQFLPTTTMTDTSTFTDHEHDTHMLSKPSCYVLPERGVCMSFLVSLISPQHVAGSLGGPLYAAYSPRSTQTTLQR